VYCRIFACRLSKSDTIVIPPPVLLPEKCSGARSPILDQIACSFPETRMPGSRSPGPRADMQRTAFRACRTDTRLRCGARAQCPQDIEGGLMVVECQRSCAIGPPRVGQRRQFAGARVSLMRFFSPAPRNRTWQPGAFFELLQVLHTQGVVSHRFPDQRLIQAPMKWVIPHRAIGHRTAAVLVGFRRPFRKLRKVKQKSRFDHVFAVSTRLAPSRRPNPGKKAQYTHEDACGTCRQDSSAEPRVGLPFQSGTLPLARPLPARFSSSVLPARLLPLRAHCYNETETPWRTGRTLERRTLQRNFPYAAFFPKARIGGR
jgi:hypothetical protein